MRHETAGADLLEAARDALMAEVVPSLTGAQRYAALMAVNALKMVERELATEGQLRAADRAVEEVAGPAATLVEALRAGRQDGNPALYRALQARAARAVAITRPDLLTQAELGPTTP